MKPFWEDMSRACRATGVLVATLVGAGYATGREMSQYFGRASWGTLIFAAVLIALFSMAFLYVGMRGQGGGGSVVTAYRWVLSVLAVVSCGVMVAAAKSLLGGAWTALFVCLAGVCICLTDKVFHVVGVLSVPVLLVLVAIVACLAPNAATGTAFLPLSAANYAGMNLLFEGELLRREGSGMRPRAVWLSGAGIAVCMALLLCAMHRVVGASDVDLPFSQSAEALGLSALSSAVIMVSILSSIAGGMRVTLAVWETRAPQALAAMLALLLSLLVSIIPFATLVRYVYPVMGWIGVTVVCAYVAVALAALIKRPQSAFGRIRRRRRWGFL